MPPISFARLGVLILLTGAAGLLACAPAAATPSSAGAKPPSGATPAGAAGTPAWAGLTLTNAADSQTFRLADFKGQVVVLESMAVWCTNCLAQQRAMDAARAQLGDKVVMVSIDVDPSESPAALKGHAASHGLSWRFAIAPPDLSRALASEFGPQFLNPPSTPVVLLDKNSQPHLTDYGQKSAQKLVELAGTLQ